jgi:hypothetical protein
MRAAVSAYRARRISRSRSIPGWIRLASYRRRCASSIRRWSSGGAVGLKRRCCCIARSPAAHKEAIQENEEKHGTFLAEMMPLHRLIESAKPLIVKRNAAGASPPGSAPRPAGSMTCQCCGRQIFARTGLIALHGYRRPGGGSQSVSCAGARHLPYEADRDCLGDLIARLREQEADRIQALEGIESERAPVILTVPDRSRPFGGNSRRPTKTVIVTRANFDEVRLAGDLDVWIPDYESFKARDLASRRSSIDRLRQELAAQTRRFDDWRPTHAWNPLDRAWRALAEAPRKPRASRAKHGGLSGVVQDTMTPTGKTGDLFE